MTDPCDEYLVSAAGYKVPDSAFSASSHLAKNNKPHFSRLDLQGGVGWVSGVKNEQQWIAVDLGMYMYCECVITTITK